MGGSRAGHKPSDNRLAGALGLMLGARLTSAGTIPGVSAERA